MCRFLMCWRGPQETFECLTVGYSILHFPRSNGYMILGYLQIIVTVFFSFSLSSYSKLLVEIMINAYSPH